MKHPLIYVFILSALLFNPAYAREKSAVYFKTPAENLAPGSEFTIDVLIDSKEPINVIDLEIAYANLNFLNFNDANSIVDIWQNSPKVLTEGLIHLGGGLIKPFSGQSGEIIKLNFRSPNPGSAELSLSKIDLYLANGLGTKIEGESSSLTLTITPEAPLQTLGQIKDNTPPILKVEVAKNPVEKSNLVVFSSRDYESGIKETYLRSRRWLAWDNWQIVNNPVKLSANVWMLQIKAVDNQNNFSQETVYIKEEIIKRIVYIVLIVGLIGLMYCLIRLRQQRKKYYN